MTLSHRIQEVRAHFNHRDLDIAYSTLLDAVLESENLDLFKHVIQNEHWKEDNPNHDAVQWIDKCNSILEKLEHLNLAEKSKKEILLRTENLIKVYSRGKFQLGPISLEIKPGELIGLVGENGNGKTTLLRILAKEIGYNSGELHYANEKSFNNTYDHRTKLVYIPQRTQKWYGKIRTNLRFAATHHGITGERNELLVEMMLIRFGLFKFRDLSWSELSSGYKMRFELARTFLRRPEILLLDEPLANLDVFAQQIVLNDLRSLAKSSYNPIGIILSSQQLFEVEKVADEVVFLKNGAPKLLDKENQSNKTQCMVELETDASREQITQSLSSIHDVEIHFYGGMYVLSSEEINNANDFLKTLVHEGVNIKYFRDISGSSKRFFID